MNNIDLHIHTNMSDGEYSPKEIIDMAYEKNIKIISITDHDSLAAYTDEIFAYAKEREIDLITGVEISTKINKCGIHVLGYNVDILNSELNEMLYKIQNARHIYLHDVGKKLQEIGYKIDIETLDKIDIVTKAHISSQIVNNPDNEERLIKDFGKIPNRGEFIEGIMNEGCKAYVTKYVPSLEEIRSVVKKAGGKVVLAHPVAYTNIDGLEENDIQYIVDNLKPDGIEANYILVSAENRKINECEKWNKFAKRNNLFVTLGSDFHRINNKCRVELGLIGEGLNITDEYVSELITKLRR